MTNVINLHNQTDAPDTFTPTDTYLPTSAYNALLDAILDPAPALCRRSQLIELLGEVAGVWPESVLDDPHRTTDHHEIVTGL